MTRPVIVGIAGGTSSGKTSFARALATRVGEEQALLLSQDAYYRDPSHLPFEERTKINYDHPDAYETELLLEHLQALERGEAIDELAYDYAEHARVTTGERLEPRPVVLIEGNLVLAIDELRRELDLKLYIDAASDIRLLRRIARDTRDRGRTLESVSQQYLETVRPMHIAFTEPSRAFADLVIPEGAHNRVALDLVVARLRELLDG